MDLGFTGTRYGMSPAQQLVVIELIEDIKPGRAHHGDCVGADAQFHEIVRKAGWWVVGHLPIDRTHRAFCVFDEWMPAKKHLERNRMIVQNSEIMIATPKDMTEQQYGGTWYTIRYTKKLERPLIVVWPNGSVEEFPCGRGYTSAHATNARTT